MDVDYLGLKNLDKVSLYPNFFFLIFSTGLLSLLTPSSRVDKEDADVNDVFLSRYVGRFSSDEAVDVYLLRPYLSIPISPTCERKQRGRWIVPMSIPVISA
jgi:hypothetical protein